MGADAGEAGTVAALPERLRAFATAVARAGDDGRVATAGLGPSLRRLEAVRPDGLRIEGTLAPQVDTWMEVATRQGDEVARVADAFTQADADRQARIADLRAAEPFEPPSFWRLVGRTGWQMVRHPLRSIQEAAARPDDALRGFAYGVGGAGIVVGLAPAGAAVAGGGALAGGGGVGLTTSGAAAASWVATAAGGLSAVSATAAEAVDDGPCRAERVATSAMFGILSGGVGGAFAAGGASRLSTLTSAGSTYAGGQVTPC